MRIYNEGEAALYQAWDDPDGEGKVVAILEVHEEPYVLPKGQIVGAGGAETDEVERYGGTAWYLVKASSGKPFKATDRELRNPPSKVGGTFTALRKQLEQQEGGKDALRAAAPLDAANQRPIPGAKRARGMAGSKFVFRAPAGAKKSPKKGG